MAEEAKQFENDPAKADQSDFFVVTSYTLEGSGDYKVNIDKVSKTEFAK